MSAVLFVQPCPSSGINIPVPLRSKASYAGTLLPPSKTHAPSASELEVLIWQSNLVPEIGCRANSESESANTQAIARVCIACVYFYPSAGRPAVSPAHSGHADGGRNSAAPCRPNPPHSTRPPVSPPPDPTSPVLPHQPSQSVRVCPRPPDGTPRRRRPPDLHPLRPAGQPPGRRRITP